MKVADKGGAGSSSAASSKPFAKFAADLAAAQEAKAIEIAESLKTKAPKAKVPFYYDKKAFAVSASSSASTVSTAVVVSTADLVADLVGLEELESTSPLASTRESC